MYGLLKFHFVIGKESCSKKLGSRKKKKTGLGLVLLTRLSGGFLLFVGYE